MLVLSLSFGLTACKPQTVVEIAPSDNAGVDNTGTTEGQASDPLAAGAPKSAEEASAEGASDADQGSEEKSQANVSPTAPQRTFAPQETGAEPNPDSPFGQLTAEEQTALVDWLSQLASSYQNISQDFNDFARDLSSFSAEAGETLADQEFFQTLNSKCREELAKINEKAASGLPAAADDLKAKADDLSSWYDNFLTSLGNLSPESGDFSDQLGQQLDQAMQRMQAFLDSLVAFSS